MQEACGPVPSATDRITTTAGLLRDPAREKQVIRWYQEFHDTIADAVLRFPKAIKEDLTKEEAETFDRVGRLFFGFMGLGLYNIEVSAIGAVGF